jgi:hypothetical protein
MAQRSPISEIDDVPLDEARWIHRGPRMDLELYHALMQEIESLDNAASRLTLPEGASPTAMKNRILRIAAQLNIPVTVRKIPGGLLFWRSTDEDCQQATAVAAWLQSARQPPHTTRRSRDLLRRLSRRSSRTQRDASSRRPVPQHARWLPNLAASHASKICFASYRRHKRRRARGVT